MADSAYWMSMCHLPARMLEDGCIDQFLSYANRRFRASDSLLEFLMGL